MTRQHSTTQPTKELFARNSRAVETRIPNANDLLFIIFIGKRLSICIIFFFALAAKTEVLKTAYWHTTRFALGMLSNYLLTRARARRRDVYFKKFSSSLSLPGAL